MKLAHVLLLDRIQALPSSSLYAERFDMTFEGGILTIVPHENPRGVMYLVPLARVSCMTAVLTSTKK